MPAKADRDRVVRVPWDEFAARFDWKQGEHVALVGPTGRGKTTLALAILPRRSWVCILATKAKDSTLAGLTGKRGGYKRITAWPPPNDTTQRVLLWPRWTGTASRGLQARTIRRAVDDIFGEEAWCIFTDDVQYLTSELRLGDVLDTLWLQARSLGISVVAATQRPRHVPLNMWTMSTHLFVWGTAHKGDLKSLGELGGLNMDTIRSEVEHLTGHDVLYINTRTGALAVTRAPGR